VLNSVTPALGGSIWRTDGTAAGTRRIGGGLFASPTVFGGVLLYAAELSFTPAGDSELELFHTDGTARGTGLLADVNSFQSDNGYHHGCYGASSDPGPGVALGNRAVFAADDGWHGRELFVTNGTRRGTVLVRDINPGRIPESPASACISDSRRDQGVPSSPESFVAYRSGALFTADDGRTGRELWWTDGTAEGTRRVRDLKPGPQGSSPHDLVPFGGKIYFFAATGGGEALWRTDGTGAGTVRVADLRLAGAPSWASRLTAVGNQLFFTVFNEATGSELWVTAGDTASTHLVADLHSGPTGSAPQALTDVQGVLVFAADDGTTGLEPWRSDGTAAGTRRLGDLNPGRDASGPGPFDLVGTAVVTGADDGTHGREPWVIPVAEILTP
jgi:ELWxxDGT repeat protein